MRSHDVDPLILTSVAIVAVVLLLMPVPDAAAAPPAGVWFQAHRGGMKEVPENTLAAFRHAWNVPGAIPEVDVCLTSDGAMVCMHDDTPARTTNAPEAFKSKRISEVPLEEVRRWDAGIKFNAKYAGEKVPLLTEVFDEMKGRPERLAYLDVKDVDFAKLAALIGQYRLTRQIIFVHGDPEVCAGLQGLFPGARTMTWLSGPAEEIKQKFQTMADAGFKGVNQLQFHLRAVRTTPGIQYALDDAFLREALAKANAAGVDLQVRPFSFDRESLRRLYGLGIRWFVTDEPRRFANALGARYSGAPL
jgi:glycerophosphoryl diester phosphodiesterase